MYTQMSSEPMRSSRLSQPGGAVVVTLALSLLDPEDAAAAVSDAEADDAEADDDDEDDGEGTNFTGL